MPWFYMSFSDRHFLGAAIVEALDVPAAIDRAWELRINPGGEVMSIEIPPDILDTYPLKYRNRLLSKSEVVHELDGKPRHVIGGICSCCGGKL